MNTANFLNYVKKICQKQRFLLIGLLTLLFSGVIIFSLFRINRTVFLSDDPDKIAVVVREASDQSKRWYSTGKAIHTYWPGEWLEYEVDIPQTGYWEITLSAKNKRLAPGWDLPPGYDFFIVDVYLDNEFKIQVKIPASQSKYHSATALIYIRSDTGIDEDSHKLGLRWTNDFYLPKAKYDANIQIRSVTLNYIPDLLIPPLSVHNTISRSTMPGPDRAWFGTISGLFTYWDNQWLEYLITITETGDWELSLTAKNKNVSGWDLPPGYDFFNVDVYIDDEYKTQLQIPASQSEYHSATALIYLNADDDIHRLRLIWTNDPYSPEDSYDANFQIESISFDYLPPPDTTPSS